MLHTHGHENENEKKNSIYTSTYPHDSVVGALLRTLINLWLLATSTTKTPTLAIKVPLNFVLKDPYMEHFTRRYAQ